MARMYEGDEWDLNEVWYTGEGGNFFIQSTQEKRDQSLTKGNAALYNNMQAKVPVRVFKSLGKRYFVFDGLWDVLEMKWVSTTFDPYGFYSCISSRIQGSMLGQ